jgi:hypothetical protein
VVAVSLAGAALAGAALAGATVSLLSCDAPEATLPPSLARASGVTLDAFFRVSELAFGLEGICKPG